MFAFAKKINFRFTITSTRQKYTDKIIQHFETPKNVGSLDNKKQNVGMGLVGAPTCGDVMKLTIEVDNNEVITDAKFKTFGCGSAIASSSLATEMLIGKSLNDSLKITNRDLASHLKLPPVKLHCSILAEDAIRASIQNYKDKNKSSIQNEKEKK
jgi:Fe-S cluster assembly scaffold IscU